MLLHNISYCVICLKTQKGIQNSFENLLWKLEKKRKRNSPSSHPFGPLGLTPPAAQQLDLAGFFPPLAQQSRTRVGAFSLFADQPGDPTVAPRRPTLPRALSRCQLRPASQRRAFLPPRAGFVSDSFWRKTLRPIPISSGFWRALHAEPPYISQPRSAASYLALIASRRLESTWLRSRGALFTSFSLRWFAHPASPSYADHRHPPFEAASRPRSIPAFVFVSGEFTIVFSFYLCFPFVQWCSELPYWWTLARPLFFQQQRRCLSLPPVASPPPI
jgi:hypothetical protein